MVFLKRLGWLLALLVLTANGLLAAVAAATVWEVRTAGADTNGGGYVTGASGTDFSQQDAAQCTATDLVLVSTTTATSATCPFSATSPGNIIQITAGTNFTVGFYQVVSQAAGTATLDRAAGTMGATGGTFALGGALASPNKACASMVAGNIEYVKASGTYTVTTSCVVTQAGTGAQFQFIGYTSSRTDNGKATWTTATNSIPLIRYVGAPLLGLTVQNFTLTNTAGTRANAINNNGSDQVQGLVVNNCTFDGFSSAIQIRVGQTTSITNVEVKNSTGDGLTIGNLGGGSNTQTVLYNVYLHNNGGDGVDMNGIGITAFVNVVSASNTADGVHFTNGGTIDDANFWFINSVLANNGGDGFESTSATVKTILQVVNSIIYGNTGTGIKAGVAPAFQYAVANGYGANGTDRSNFNAGTGDVALSANPFTNSGSGDFSLNATAGGGAALKGVGFPGVSIFGTGHLDIGALQSAAPASKKVFGSAN
jgi:hypothetical protein